MANTDRAEANRALRAQTHQVDTSGTSGDSPEKDLKDAGAVWTAGAGAAAQTPTKFPTGEDTQLNTENE